jgi:hypothetical protein
MPEDASTLRGFPTRLRVFALHHYVQEWVAFGRYHSTAYVVSAAEKSAIKRWLQRTQP